MVGLMRSIDSLVGAAGVRLPSAPHARGAFAQIILGVNHGGGASANVRLSSLPE